MYAELRRGGAARGWLALLVVLSAGCAAAPGPHKTGEPAEVGSSTLTPLPPNYLTRLFTEPLPEDPPVVRAAPPVERDPSEDVPAPPPVIPDGGGPSYEVGPLPVFAGNRPCDAAEDDRLRDSVAGAATTAFHCREIPLGVTFSGGAGFAGLRAVAVEVGELRYRQLVARVDDGLVALPVLWAIDDPDSPGCPSLVSPTAIERAWITRGTMALTMLGETTTWVTVPDGRETTDNGQRDELLRALTLIKRTDTGVYVRRFTAGMGGVYLGSKTQPRQKPVSWAGLPWQDYVTIRLDASGAPMFPKEPDSE